MQILIVIKRILFCSLSFILGFNLHHKSCNPICIKERKLYKIMQYSHQRIESIRSFLLNKLQQRVRQMKELKIEIRATLYVHTQTYIYTHLARIIRDKYTFSLPMRFISKEIRKRNYFLLTQNPVIIAQTKFQLNPCRFL